MASEDRFKQAVIATIAKRAANQCSNPDCGAVTSGPTDDPSGSVNVGEAAHIYGAHPGSARYKPDMVSADRSAIANAIWLCSNCHKIVDDDPSRYPDGLLFEWQSSHEQRIREQVGKAGAELRRRYEQRHLEEFGKLSYLAERLIVEKAEFWEYQLTSEVLRYEMAPILRRWRALKQGLYIKAVEKLATPEIGNWLAIKMDEASKICDAFGELINNEFQRAWGEPGLPGDEMEIISTCRLYAEMCDSCLRWEEGVQFAHFDDAFDDLKPLLHGMVGMFIDEAAKLPQFLGERLNDEPQLGTHRLTLTLALPDGHVDAISKALAKGVRLVVAENS